MPEERTRVPVDLEIVKLGVSVELLFHLVSYKASMDMRATTYAEAEGVTDGSEEAATLVP